MFTYIARRILYSIPVLIVASFLTFWGLRIAFDPLAKYRNLKDTSTIVPEQRVRLGLNHPIYIQWWNWFTQAIHGNLGTSARTNNPVLGEIIHAMGTTMHLIIWSTLLSAGLAIGVGVYSAVKQYSVGDYLFTGASYIGLAMPPFWFGLMAIVFLVTWPVTHFNLSKPIFYSIGLHSTGESGIFNLDYYRHLALPVLTLTVQSIASWSRFKHTSMLDVLSADYVRTARAKGVPRRKVIFKHTFRNTLIPLLTVMALDTAFLFGGLIITEQIFSISGMGKYFLDSLSAGDAPALLGWTVVTATIVIIFNLFADILYSVLDPADPVDMTSTNGDEPRPLSTLAPTDVDLELAVGAEAIPRTQWQLFWRRFFRHRLAVGSLLLLGFLCFACFGARWVAPYSIDKIDISLVGQAHGPTWKHWMGTDEFGHDQLSVLLYAGQISLRIGLAVAVFSTIVGVLIGAAAGYFGGLLDRLLSAITDLFLVIPELALLAVALSYFGRNPTTIIFVLAALGWTYIARVVRGQVLSLKEKEFVEATHTSGASSWRIIIRHILPNLVGAIMVNLTLAVAVAIVAESTLSFLGFGINPPANSWGLMLSNNEGAVNDPSKIHLLLFPGLMLLITVMCVNFLGDGFRDAFDPQAKH